jgi:UDP-glucose:(heptosyl)LPS alpha-1,3-glucosyltransferase
LKLGVLLDRFDPAKGGAEAHTDALLRRAVAEGEEAALASLEGDPPPGVEGLRVEAPSRRPARDRVFAEAGERRLREAGCDVVLAVRHAPRCDVYLPHGGLVGDAVSARDLSAGGAGFFRRAARVFSGKHRFFFEAEAAALGAAEGPVVIAVSRLLAAQIGARYPAAARRTVVVPNGVDTERFDPAPFAGGRAKLREALGAPDAYVGLHLAHEPRLKGLETVLRAMALAPVKDLPVPFHLLAVGRTADRRFARLAKRLGVEGRVRFHGAVPDPRPLYAAADVLVHPTWYDPCSLTCLEAFAMGLPVVTTPQNGASELMGQKAGIVVEEPGNPEAVAIAIRVLAEPALRAQTADDARYLATKNRQATRLDRVLDVCRAVARGEPVPRGGA